MAAAAAAVLTSMLVSQRAGASVLGDSNMESIEDYPQDSRLRQLGRAVGQLEIAGAAGRSVCTAFMIADSIALTTDYCAIGAVGGTKPAEGPTLTLRMGFTARDAEPPPTTYPVEVLQVLEGPHLAVLRVAGRPGHTWGKLRLAREMPGEGSPLVALHHPLGQPLQVSRVDCEYVRTDGEMFQHTCDTMGGSSGAPLLDVATGAVAGLHTMGAVRAGGLNGAVPSVRILEVSDLANASALLLSAEEPPQPITVDSPAPTDSRGARRISVVTDSGDEVLGYADSHALLIGVSEYTGSWSTLPRVPTDIAAVEEALKAHGFVTHVVMNPDLARLQQAIGDFIFDFGRERENRLVFYYAGHGESLRLDDGRLMGYLVMRDAPFADQDPRLFNRAALSMAHFEGFAKDIVAKHALFVFDSCFAGTIFSELRGAPASITRKTAESVRQFITSGTEEQEVPDNSVFRIQLVHGLRGEADLNEDGYVTGSELGSFLEDTVTNLTGKAQTPVYGKMPDVILGRGDFVFELGEDLESSGEAWRYPRLVLQEPSAAAEGAGGLAAAE